MRLERLQRVLEKKGFPFSYCEEEGCGSVDFEYRGVRYHVWEFHDRGEWGAETNVINMGKHEDITGNYEETVIDMIQKWN